MRDLRTRPSAPMPPNGPMRPSAPSRSAIPSAPASPSGTTRGRRLSGRGRLGLASVAGLLGAALIVPSAITAAPNAGTASIAATPSTTEPGAIVTIDGTGFARRQTGTLAFESPAGTSVAFRSSRRGDFSVQLSIPTDALAGIHTIVAQDSAGDMATTSIAIVDPIPVASPSVAPTPSPTATPPPPPSGSTAYSFDDEFDGSTLGSAWGTAGHWSDLSEATIDRSHTSVANGVMSIKATRTGAGAWVSDTVDTFGRFTQTYGYFEARLRFTSGKGLWPAFWLAHDWTGDKSELDINETLANPYPGYAGDNSGSYYATVHIADGSTPQGSDRYDAGTDLGGAWHVYGMDWRADHISFYIDGKLWHTYTGKVPSTPLCVIFNLAVGGWAGPSDSTTPSPSYLDVDWVRVRA